MTKQEFLAMSLNEEIWRNIDGFNGYYQVSSLGNVRSVDRVIFNKGNKANYLQKGRILKPNKDSGGYLYVGLFVSGKKAASVKIHRLVAKYFCDGYQEGYEVNHRDGNRMNNIFTNLEWCSRSYNVRDAYIRNGGHYGENGAFAKLKNEYIPIIITLYHNGVKQDVIANAFNVSQTSISNIIRNITFKTDLISKGDAIDVNTLPENPYK